MIKLIDPDHPFYRPLSIRLTIVAICAAWAGLEFWGGSPTWGMISLAIAAYTGSVLILFYSPPAPAAEAGKTSAADSDDKPEEDVSEAVGAVKKDDPA